jgi:hypothetical protein
VKASAGGTKGLVKKQLHLLSAYPRPQLHGHKSYKENSADKMKKRVPPLSTWLGEIGVIYRTQISKARKSEEIQRKIRRIHIKDLVESKSLTKNITAGFSTAHVLVPGDSFFLTCICLSSGVYSV